MTIRFRSAAPFLLAAVAVVAFAAQDAIVLKRVPKVGDVVKMKLKADIDVAGQSATLTGTVSEKITKVDANGDYTVESSQKDTKLIVGSNEIPTDEQPARTQVFHASGELVSSGSDTDPNAFRLANITGMRLTDKPLKVGDTWEVEIKADAKTGVVAAKGTYKVEALEKVGNFDTARIKGSIKETTGSEPAGSDTVSWLSVKDGSLVKQEGTFTNAPFPGAPGPVNAKISLTRID